jgi:hypothetical protein
MPSSLGHSGFTASNALHKFEFKQQRFHSFNVQLGGIV